MRAGCTIISPNYLPFARTLAGSYLAVHPDHRFFVLLVADLAESTSFRIDPSFTPVLLRDLGIADLEAVAMKYDILELNTNVKPTFLKYLLDTHELTSLVYLDPDIFVYHSLNPVFEALEQGVTAVLTPHMTEPVFDGKAPSEQDLLYNGTYNLGFIGVGRSGESRRLLDWWEVRCLQQGFSEGRTGLFVDQKWINLAPGLFDRIVISRDAGLNMAYWNLHERTLVSKDSDLTVLAPGREPVPLRFFHFSGLDEVNASVVSRNSDRYTLDSRPDLQHLFRDYRAALAANRGSAAEQIPYGFDCFTDGTTITRLARRLFAAHEPHFTSPDTSTRELFQAGSSFYKFARSQKLVKGVVTPPKATWSEYRGQDRRVQAVHRLLRWSLHVLGPHRYELLMRYLAYIAVLRNQGTFLRDKTWPSQAGSDAP